MDLCLVTPKSFDIRRQIQLVIPSVKASVKVETNVLYLGVRWTAKCDKDFVAAQNTRHNYNRVVDKGFVERVRYDRTRDH